MMAKRNVKGEWEEEHVLREEVVTRAATGWKPDCNKTSFLFADRVGYRRRWRGGGGELEGLAGGIDFQDVAKAVKWECGNSGIRECVNAGMRECVNAGMR